MPTRRPRRSRPGRARARPRAPAPARPARTTFEMPTLDPSRAGFTNTGRPSPRERVQDRVAALLPSRARPPPRSAPAACPACAIRRLKATLSMQTAEPSTPAPTYGHVGASRAGPAPCRPRRTGRAAPGTRPRRRAAPRPGRDREHLAVGSAVARIAVAPDAVAADHDRARRRGPPRSSPSSTERAESSETRMLARAAAARAPRPSRRRRLVRRAPARPTVIVTVAPLAALRAAARRLRQHRAVLVGLVGLARAHADVEARVLAAPPPPRPG